jgi:YggT family protein
MANFIVIFINLLFEALSLAIIIRVFLSWFRVNPDNRLVQLLYQITEPVLTPFRRLIPPIGMMDITPIVALFVLQILRSIVVNMLAQLLRGG